MITVSKTIKNHETKESNITDSIISSYGVGPTDDKGRPLFGLQALRRPKGQTEPNSDDYSSRPESPRDIRDSSGRAFFGLNALRTPKNDPYSERPESPTRRDSLTKHERSSCE